MNIVSWNIQAGLGLDGKVDLQRIADVLRALPFHNAGAPDVICLQEVSRHFTALTNGVACDQAAQLQALFPEYTGVFRPAVDLAPLPTSSSPARRQFGCMIFSRHPITQVFNHLLTQQAASGKRMQRHLLEAVISAPNGPLRIATTHLEYNSQPCRLAQVEHLLQLHEEALAPTDAAAVVQADSPYSAAPRPAAAIFCGDFNFLADSAEYQCITTPRLGFTDAWRLLDGPTRSFPTCGFDCPEQWPQGPHCRDFFFLTPELATQVRQIGVNTQTRASDHQPIYLALD